MKEVKAEDILDDTIMRELDESGFVQSLNLSVTAGICLFEMTRQRRATGLEQFLLGEAAAASAIEAWLKK